jgi:DNA-binding transcriptional ArsR family regulator
MKDKTIYTLHAAICKTLANPLRIEIIDLLGGKELSFSEILEETGTLKSNLSQHISVMVTNGILNSRKEGLKVFYNLSSPKVAEACRIMRELLIENIRKNSEILTILNY